MKKKLLLPLLIFASCLCKIAANGATPLTDFTFHSSYHHIRLVDEAYKHKALTDSMMLYLTDNNSIDAKMALINALGWVNSQEQNGTMFLGFLMKKYAVADSTTLLKKLSADELLCLAYLSAMANYNYVNNAMHLAKMAVKKNKTSFTFQFIYHLIQAQEMSWIGTMNCKIYKNYKALKENQKIKKDLRVEAMNEIYTFFERFVEDCR